MAEILMSNAAKTRPFFYFTNVYGNTADMVYSYFIECVYKQYELEKLSEKVQFVFI